MKKIVRNMSDETSKAFWASAEKTAAPVKDWPAWKKGGIEVQQSGITPAPENDRPKSEPR
jgi:hypothetical protein